MAHGSLSRIKPSSGCALHPRVRVSPPPSSFSRINLGSSQRNSLQSNNAGHSRRQCGSGAHEPSSSRYCWSSGSSLRSRRAPILTSRVSSRFVVRSAKENMGKDSKGKKKGGKGGGGGGGGGGGSKGEAPKRTGPRPNVWSKDIAETEYQASRTEAKPPSAKQQGREVGKERRGGDARGKGGQGGSTTGGNGIVAERAAPTLQTDFDDDYTGVVATGGIPVETQEILQAPVWFSITRLWLSTPSGNPENCVFIDPSSLLLPV